MTVYYAYLSPFFLRGERGGGGERDETKRGCTNQ